jgi:hypothetical protein
MKKDKYILASGDSFTDRNFRSVDYPDYDCSFKKWPELLANRLQTNVINLGKCGVDNDHIFYSAYDHILDNHEKIELVVIGMTEAWRFTAYNNFLVNPIALVSKNLSIREWHDYEKVNEPIAKFLMVDQLLSPTDWARNARIMFSHFISHIIRIQKLCKTFGLKLIVIPLLGLGHEHIANGIYNFYGKTYL